MRYVGLASLLFDNSLLAGYFDMDNRRLMPGWSRLPQAADQSQYPGGASLPSGGGDLYWKPVLHMEQTRRSMTMGRAHHGPP